MSRVILHCHHHHSNHPSLPKSPPFHTSPITNQITITITRSPVMAKFDFIFIFSTLGLLITRLISESIHTTSIAIPSLNPPSPSLSTYDLIYCFFFLLQIVYIILHYGHHSNRFQMFPLFIAAAMEAVAVLIMDGDDHGWTRTTL
eukprot:TRINITY_DN4963_c0_g1_i3.p1 TRINITY_DN4963_c0_g1~~TRINITY_DN4963_c0_g1_i3.p1  ORF type:complete len:145 (+),score=24.87 TRINITY_DN4963_c0_g1_i3:11-445(+)